MQCMAMYAHYAHMGLQKMHCYYIARTSTGPVIQYKSTSRDYGHYPHGSLLNTICTCSIYMQPMRGGTKQVIKSHVQAP